ncbi:MAG TPA: VIT1/CCC1 transporter family protein [Vicinamibacteria bacterium]|nr:VIT1/CCC1 transporter family protein [Vicinamibacteria bacterium]
MQTSNAMQTFREGLISRYLAPGDSLSEILFGIIMTLTFTLGAGVLVREGPDAARELLAATVGCNVAWGLIDGIMYLGGMRFERARRARLRDAIRGAASAERAARLVAGELDEILEHVTDPSERAALYRRIVRAVQQREPPSARLNREDVFGAVASFWLVFFSSVPAAVPFLFIDNAWVALRVSNAILIGSLFLVGYRWARHTNLPPLRAGLALMIGGMLLVIVAIALGG